MSRASDFDDFVARTWTPLLEQTFAMCGDLAVARYSLESGYVDTWRHWRRARRHDPAARVLDHAWRRAERHGRASGHRRPADLAAPQAEVYAALQALPVPTRKALVLAGLSDRPEAEVAAAVGDSVPRTEDRLTEALTQLMRALGVEQDQVADRLRLLVEPTHGEQPPVATVLRGAGRRRTLTRVAALVVVILLVGLAGGYLAIREPEPRPEKALPLGPAVTDSMLLTPRSLTALGPEQRWRVRRTGDNTAGTGLNSPCQQQRFADPKGSQALVRRLAFTGQPRKRAVQTLEVSRSEAAAGSAYDRVVDWFAGCQQARLQLLDNFRVSGLGDGAQILQFRAAGLRKPENFAVGIARSGRITTWTTLLSQGTKGAGIKALVRALDASVFRVCASRLSGPCAVAPRYRQLELPPSGEAPGLLAVADLPPVGKVTRRWVGTDAAPAPRNPAQTSCDQANFVKAGAVRTLTRTFLIPRARLPREFGVTESYGRFRTVAAARRFVDRIRQGLDGCEDRQLSATVGDVAAQRDGRDGSSYFVWRLDSEISDRRTVRFRTGVARVGSNVVQVTFIPGGGRTDLSPATFRALVVRARDRLFELPRTSPARARRAAPRG